MGVCELQFACMLVVEVHLVKVAHRSYGKRFLCLAGSTTRPHTYLLNTRSHTLSFSLLQRLLESLNCICNIYNLELCSKIVQLS